MPKQPLPSVSFFAFMLLCRCLLLIGIAAYSRLKHAEKEKLNAELHVLKTQSKFGHFLFNTLNSIYALAVANLISLPSQLHAWLPLCVTPLPIPPMKEWNWKDNSIRAGLHRTWKTSPHQKGWAKLWSKLVLGKQIAPMLFIPIIENAFKHGVSTNENSCIRISIDIREKNLNLHVKNTKVSTTTQHSTGLGLKNVKMRLQSYTRPTTCSLLLMRK